MPRGYKTDGYGPEGANSRARQDGPTPKGPLGHRWKCCRCPGNDWIDCHPDGSDRPGGTRTDDVCGSCNDQRCTIASNEALGLVNITHCTYKEKVGFSPAGTGPIIYENH